MKPFLDQSLVFATVGVAICYFVLGALRARRNSGKCAGGCGCSLGDKSKVPSPTQLGGVAKTPLGDVSKTPKSGFPETTEGQNTKAPGA